MWEYNSSLKNDELQHHGILGMKWGVRRSPQQLGHLVDEYKNKNESLAQKQKKASDKALIYKKKASIIDTHNSPYQARLTKATAKKAKYDLKINKQMSKKNPNVEKIANYSKKTDKYRIQILKNEKKLKFNKYKIKSEKYQAKANKAKKMMENNQNFINMCNKTIKEYDSNKLRRGRLLMQYAN